MLLIFQTVPHFLQRIVTLRMVLFMQNHFTSAVWKCIFPSLFIENTFKFTKPPLILMFLKLEKKTRKMQKNGKKKKQISEIQKTQKQNKR